MAQPTELDKNLEDLELRIERVRGLYEQYFIGIERLEPLTPRKEVDRQIWALRKQKIRNTAQRFRFNMLAQRYNTLQHHWGRITREMENGTYKRDVMRAAARFGADAVGTLGKGKNKRLLAAAEEADRERKARQQKPVHELNEDDTNWEDDFDDEAPTPPPVSRQVPAIGAFGALGARQAQQAAPSPGAQLDPRYAQAAGHAPGSQPQQSGHAAPGHPAAPAGGYPPNAQAGYPPNAQAGYPPSAQPVGHVPNAHPPPVPRPKKSAAGLRWGGGPAQRTPDEEAAVRNRLAALAAQVRDDAGAGPAKPLMSGPLDLDFDSRPPPPRSSRGNKAPLIQGPLGLDIGLPPEPTPPARPNAAMSSEAAAPVPPVATPPAMPQRAVPAAPSAPPPIVPEPPKRRPGVQATPARTAPKSRAGDAELDDARLRQIYEKYVETKRKSKESTAGVTYEKLADSLRVQAEKLKTKHAGKRVDYEVVTKNGKTLLKPIIR